MLWKESATSVSYSQLWWPSAVGGFEHENVEREGLNRRILWIPRKFYFVYRSALCCEQRVHGEKSILARFDLREIPPANEELVSPLVILRSIVQVQQHRHVRVRVLTICALLV